MIMGTVPGLWMRVSPTLVLCCVMAAKAQTIGARLREKLAAGRASAGPKYEMLNGAEAMWQIPASPVGTIFLAHGCSHSATDFWASTPACPQCLGLPEVGACMAHGEGVTGCRSRHKSHLYPSPAQEVRIVQAALKDGYAVIALSSQDRQFSRCWDFETDGPVVRGALAAFRSAHALNSLPLAALGASSGGAFALQLAGIMKLTAVVSQIMAIPPAVLPAHMPPTLFVHMPRDVRTASTVHKCVRKLRADSGPGAASQIEVNPQPLSASFFMERIVGLAEPAAVRLREALATAGLLDQKGYLREDPRRSSWREAVRSAPGLLGQLPGPAGAGGGRPDSLEADASAVAEVLNVAWAMHEIVSDQVRAEPVDEPVTAPTSTCYLHALLPRACA